MHLPAIRFDYSFGHCETFLLLFLAVRMQYRMSYLMHIQFICSCIVYYLFTNSNGWMYVCARIENGLVEESEELAGEAPEQQLVGGGKCPLTYLCPIHSIIHFPHLHNYT
jgi:hypothetical protein